LDELGDSFFSSFIVITSINRNAADQLIDLKISPWFDNVQTLEKEESLNDDIICAFSQAVARLKSRLGNDPLSWEWGKIHQLSLKHPLSSARILNRVFDLNTDSIPLGGSFHTISSYSYDEVKPFAIDYGSSHRHIFDVGNWDNSLTAIPTGNSGIPASRHYCDQTTMFMEGKYHHDYFSRDKIIKSARYHMTFKNSP